MFSENEQFYWFTRMHQHAKRIYLTASVPFALPYCLIAMRSKMIE